LVVIPGNHDVFESGVAAGMPRLDWFDRIFNGGDTTTAEMALRAKLQVDKLGFNSHCLGPRADSLIQRSWARLRSLVAARMIAPWRKKRDWANHLRTVNPGQTVITTANSPLLLALIDSNPTQSGFLFRNRISGQ
jgi:hypothetical protein